MQLAVGNGGILTRFIPFPDNRGFIPAGFEMPVYTVVTGIGFCSAEPLNRYGSFAAVIIVRAYLVPLFKPVKVLRHFSPESFRISNAAVVHFLVLLKILEVRPLGRGFGRMN